MKFHLASLRTSLAALSLLVSAAAATNAHAQTVITTLPYTISASGVYVLDSNLNSNLTTGSLITINASNVTLDMQGFYIAGPVGVSNQDTAGIYANESANLVIKNGTIAYCNVGVQILGNGQANTNAVNAQVDNMRVTFCYNTGIDLENVLASRITNSQVSHIGFTGSGDNVFGIDAIGAGMTIQGNLVGTILAAAAADSFGISTNPGIFVRQNQVFNAGVGVAGGIYQSNQVSGCASPFLGGINGGRNTSDTTTTTLDMSNAATREVRNGHEATHSQKVHIGHRPNQ